MVLEHKIPDVFQLKPINNECWPKEPKVLNNSCHCNCHHQILMQQHTKEDNLKKFWLGRIKDKMAQIKIKRTRVLIVITGILCFIFGLTVPLLFMKVNGGGENVQRGISRKVPVIGDFRLQSPLISMQHQLRNNTLQNVFISVKTTRKYHYPRVVIQLETWASLVKSQVML